MHTIEIKGSAPSDQWTAFDGESYSSLADAMLAGRRVSKAARRVRVVCGVTGRIWTVRYV
jgi:hypothetical protein